MPRLINAICDRALLGAYTEDQSRVGSRTVRRAVREVLGRPRAKRPARRWHWAVAVAALVLAGGGALAAGSRLGPAVRDLAHLGRARPAAAPAAPATSGSPAAPARGEISGLPAKAAVVAAVATPEVHLPPASELRPAAVDAGKAAPEVVQTAAPAARAEPKSAPPSSPATSLARLLADPAVRADKASAFSSMYARWGLEFDPGKHALGCDRGRSEGLRCLFGAGNLAKLRRIDLPAILELGPAGGPRHYAALVALDDQSATLEVGGRRIRVPQAEMAPPLWDGTFILLWRAPAIAGQVLEQGQRSADVMWVRERLGAIDGTPVPERDRDVFDDALRARIVAFQRSRALVPDGIVGEETFVHLSFAPGEPAMPRLAKVGS